MQFEINLSYLDVKRRLTTLIMLTIEYQLSLVWFGQPRFSKIGQYMYKIMKINDLKLYQKWKQAATVCPNDPFPGGKNL